MFHKYTETYLKSLAEEELGKAICSEEVDRAVVLALQGEGVLALQDINTVNMWTEPYLKNETEEVGKAIFSEEVDRAIVLVLEGEDVLVSQDINIQEFFGLPHKCKECRAEYNFKSEFERHLLLHSSEYSWCCPHCKKTFKYKGSWTRHILKKH